MKIQKSEFQAAWWLTNPHLQTIWASLFYKKQQMPRERETFVLPDGDFVHLDWIKEGKGPIVLIFHGLTGSSESSYAYGLQYTLWKKGWRSVVMNFRGCSGEPNNRPRSYHSGATEDIQSLFAEVRKREPDTPIAACGFSLGGNALLKWLGENPEKDGLFAATAVSVPFLLNRCSDRMEKGFSKVYLSRFIRDLRQSVDDKIQHFEQKAEKEYAQRLKEIGDLTKVKTFWEFDDRVTAPLHGFESAADYYQRSSSRQFLKAIQTPTLIVQSQDDPFMDKEIIPSADELSDHVTLELAQKGGHVGFLTGKVPGKPVFWLKQRLPSYLEQRFSQL